MLKDILDKNALTWQYKSFVVTATEYKGSDINHNLKKHIRTMVFEKSTGSIDAKGIVEVKGGAIIVKDKSYFLGLSDGFYKPRKLTVRECMRLQTVPETYDFSCVSNSQAYKMLGNGWTVQVIAHLLKSIKEERMELKVNDYQLPEALNFNYEELKAELTSRVKVYSTMVYDDAQIKTAKADRADLNRLKKALNDERIRREREYMAPFNDFKAKINEIISIIDKPAAIIDQRIKEYEQHKAEEKTKAIEALFDSKGFPEFVILRMIWSPKWANASTSMSSIEAELDAAKADIENSVQILEALPEFGFEALEFYKRDLDIAGALAQATKLVEIAKAKKEAEAREAERKAREEEVKKLEATMPAPEPVQATFTTPESFETYTGEVVKNEPKRMWVNFSAYLTSDDALALKAFFEARNIEFKPL